MLKGICGWPGCANLLGTCCEPSKCKYVPTTDREAPRQLCAPPMMPLTQVPGGRSARGQYLGTYSMVLTSNFTLLCGLSVQVETSCFRVSSRSVENISEPRACRKEDDVPSRFSFDSLSRSAQIISRTSMGIAANKQDMIQVSSRRFVRPTMRWQLRDHYRNRRSKDMTAENTQLYHRG